VEVLDLSYSGLSGENTVVGSCAGPNVGSATVPFFMGGSFNGSAFEFQQNVWQVGAPLILRRQGNVLTGSLGGPIPGPAQLSLTFRLVAE
jgi:hypothetical protein